MGWIKWDKSNNLEVLKMGRLWPSGVDEQRLTLMNNSLKVVKMIGKDK